jgi:hypothetical protein
MRTLATHTISLGRKKKTQYPRRVAAGSEAVVDEKQEDDDDL